jgi:hypothetical protein
MTNLPHCVRRMACYERHAISKQAPIINFQENTKIKFEDRILNKFVIKNLKLINILY